MVERYPPLQSAVCSAIVPAGAEAFSGGPSAVYIAIAGVGQQQCPRLPQQVPNSGTSLGVRRGKRASGRSLWRR